MGGKLTFENKSYVSKLPSKTLESNILTPLNQVIDFIMGALYSLTLNHLFIIVRFVLIYLYLKSPIIQIIHSSVDSVFWAYGFAIITSFLVNYVVTVLVSKFIVNNKGFDPYNLNSYVVDHISTLVNKSIYLLIDLYPSLVLMSSFDAVSSALDTQRQTGEA